ncbi:MAG: hypothetical protein K1X72_01035 [Pyrinomonadaceae bacterium]|nr:hypothetical protein [Pyrinomonadaceae bacterium]
MKSNFSLSLTKVNAFISIVIILSFSIGCNLFPNVGKSTSGGDRSGTGWKVWVKTSPCSGGRTDWISIAKENPEFGGGGSSFQTADMLTSGMSCTKLSDNNCTFSQAMDSADKIRASSSFTKYCCRDYSVWKNTQTGEFTITKGQGTTGFGWQFEKGNLCCEEAENIAGKPGACSGSTQSGNSGNTQNTGCAKEYYVYEEVRTGKRFVTRGRFTTPEMRLVKDNLCCEEAGKLAGVPVTCNEKH